MGRPSQVPGSYFIGESDLFQSLGSPAQINEIPDITPEMRIGRPVFTNDDRGVNTLLKREWHDYSDEIGSKNYGRGNAVAYGSMVLTHVKAVEMGRMLDRSMPQLFAGRPDNKRILQAYRSISREYTDFVREQDTEVVIAQNNAVFSNDMDRDEYEKNEYIRTKNWFTCKKN